MRPVHPRAFISHSSEDARFVEKLATDLLANGVDAWYSAWEIRPGDSIRAKLDDGLQNCEVFVIVLSKASINRPWVQTELDAATVRKLDGKVQRIIPVKIDNCGELPPMLGSLLWQDFSTTSYEVAFKGVLNSIFAVDTKPPLGPIPDLPPLVLFRRSQTFSKMGAVFWMAMALGAVLVASKLTINIWFPQWISQLVAGGLLAALVWKFFERVEAALTETTKLEIAIWLLGVNVGQKLEPWPETFANVFDRVFGKKHLSWKCFWRSALLSTGLGSIGLLLGEMTDRRGDAVSSALFAGFLWSPLRVLSQASVTRYFSLYPRGVDSSGAIRFPPLVLIVILSATFFMTNTFPDYLSLFETRLILRFMRSAKGIILLALLVLDGVLTAGLSLVWNSAAFVIVDRHSTFSLNITEIFGQLWMLMWLVYPALFTSIWLWLYAGSGFLLKSARRFDIGFDWFNRKFDIEKKPLQSIGLVAGAVVAVVYWSVVVVSRVMK